MVRTQIQLTESQASGLRKLAARKKVSMASIIRGYVDDNLARDSDDEKWERAKAAVGFLKGGPSDLSENHDHYLAEAYSE